MNPFEHIYNTNYWGFGSGHGSLPSVTKAYRAYIEDFLIENKIDSILDYGCGDWQFSRLIRWGNVRYTGVDIADAVIEMNQRKYGSKNIRFKTINPGSTEIPDADLLISKDVLQHMTRSDIEIFLKNILPRYKLALITNCITPEERLNIDIPSGEFRPLDLRKAPYNVQAKCVFTFEIPNVFSWRRFKTFVGSTKMVLLLQNQN